MCFNAFAKSNYEHGVTCKGGSERSFFSCDTRFPARIILKLKIRVCDYTAGTVLKIKAERRVENDSKISFIPMCLAVIFVYALIKTNSLCV